MRKIILLFASLSSIIFSCSSNYKDEENSISKNEIVKIANDYGYNLENTSSNRINYKVSNTIELKNVLDSITINFKSSKFESSDGSVKNDFDKTKVNKSIDSILKLLCISVINHNIVYLFDN